VATETLVLDDDRQVTYEVVGDGEPALWFEGGPGFNAALGRGDFAHARRLLLPQISPVSGDAQGPLHAY
jgi:hypothetical protein